MNKSFSEIPAPVSTLDFRCPAPTKTPAMNVCLPFVIPAFRRQTQGILGTSWIALLSSERPCLNIQGEARLRKTPSINL